MLTPRWPENYTDLPELGDVPSIPWNDRDAPLQDQKTVIDFFAERVNATPNAIAVKDPSRFLSYAELDRLSNRVAVRLVNEGLRVEELVALLMDRSCNFVIAAIGVLKAGGSYLPLDINCPIRRLSVLLADSGARFVIGGGEQCQRSADFVERAFVLGGLDCDFANESDNGVSFVPDPRRRAYVIYTSGSTGVPKGVEIEHHSLSNLVQWYKYSLSLSELDRVSMVANVSFDGSIGDLWPALCAGATVVAPAASLISHLDGLISWLAEEQITISFIPTALVELMFSRSWPLETSIRYLITGGDTLRIRPPKELSFTLINGYGPTENTVFSTWSVVSPEGGDDFPAIGRPIGNVRAYVLDGSLQPVPAGVEGELYLGGEQVARGYWNQSSLTHRVFLPDPFAKSPDAKMYRTGDWVYWGLDNELHFVGRKDDQVQIYGHRFELGEVEYVLMTHPSVRQVCCRPLMEHGAVTGVAAHIVPFQTTPFLREELRKLSMDNLPIAAVPEAIMYHDRFPVTSQGKVDRFALDAAVNKKYQSGSIPASPGYEAEISNLWIEMLPNAAEADREANFFNLGGDSLTAARLLIGFERITDRRLSLTTFLQNPTLEGLTSFAKGDLTVKFAPLITLHGEGARPRIFFLYDLFGDLGCYLNLVNALGADQPSVGFTSPVIHDLEKMPSSLEQAAREIVSCLLEFKMKSPPALIGYSWGGWLAFEVARQWVAVGREAPFVGLIGTEAPIRKVTAVIRVMHFLRWTPRWFLNLAAEGNKSGKRLFKALLRLNQAMVIRNSLPLAESITSPIMKGHLDLVLKYAPVVPRPMVLDLFRERNELKPFGHPLEPAHTRHELDDGWGRWVGSPPRIHWVDSDHDNILKPPAVHQLAGKIREAMDAFYQI